MSLKNPVTPQGIDHETPIKSEVTLQLIISPLKGLAHYLMRLVTFKTSKLLTYSYKLQRNTLSNIISSVSVLIHTGQSNNNAEASNDVEYNPKVKVRYM